MLEGSAGIAAANLVLAVVEEVFGVVGEAAVPCVVGEGVVFGGSLDGGEAVKGVVGVEGVVVADRGSVGIVDEDVLDLIEGIVGIRGVVLCEAIVMGVVGIGVEGFFDELVEVVVMVVCGGILGDGLQDVAGGAVGCDLLSECRGCDRGGAFEGVEGEGHLLLVNELLG